LYLPVVTVCDNYAYLTGIHLCTFYNLLALLMPNLEGHEIVV
jgi:hypothetical protein